MNTISAKVAIFSVSMLMGSLAIISAANASVVSFTKDADGVTVVLDRGVMKVKVCKDDIIEVKCTRSCGFSVEDFIRCLKFLENTTRI